MESAVDWLIAGSPRSGTTTLHDWITSHPGASGADAQEINFFDRKFDMGFDWYQSRFIKAPAGTLRGESSPNYMYDAAAVERIAAAAPDVRIAVVLREPISRAWSHYWYNRMLNLEDRSVDEVFQADAPDQINRHNHVDFSRYASRVERLFDVFGRDQVLVQLTDDLHAKPEEAHARLLFHVGLDPEAAPPPVMEATNTARGARFPAVNHWVLNGRTLRRSGKLRRAVIRLNTKDVRYPELPEEIRTRLAPAFVEENARLAAVLGRELPSRWVGVRESERV